jgi:hypothetical protein
MLSRSSRRSLAAALALVPILGIASQSSADVIGGVNMGTLTDYLFVFADGSAGGVIDFNLQAASKGYQGDIAVNGIAAGTDLRTSGQVPYQGTMYTNAGTLDSWQDIVDDNKAGGPFAANNSTGSYNQVARLAGLQADLTGAFTQVNALVATPGFTSRSATSLDGLNTQNGINETIVINVTSGFQVSSQIGITGDAGDVYVLRWDTDANFVDGYEGQVKFQSGGAIVPHGGLTAANFIHVAGDINASGGGTTPPIPYPQGVPIVGGDDFNGGGFFTGYWLTTGDPTTFETSSLSNAIFIGGWYTSTAKFSLTSGSSGIHVPPDQGGPPPPVPVPLAALGGVVLMGALGVVRCRRPRGRVSAA